MMSIKTYYPSPKHKEYEARFSRRMIRAVSVLGEILYSVVMYPALLIRYVLKRLIPKRKWKYQACICAIFKNESKYFAEWITYHTLIGIEHFYLYNNNSDDDFRRVLAPYIDSGIVTLCDWPENYAQKKAYQDCWRRFGNETHWLGFIDLDEFVNLRKESDIRVLLNKFNAFPSLYLPWRMFGTSGYLEEPPSCLVTEIYTSCWKDYCNTGKSFINCEFSFFNFLSPHYFAAKSWNKKLFIPLFGVSENYTFAYGNEIFFRFLFNIFKPRSCINHYWSKSYNWYQYKDGTRGDASSRHMGNVRKAAGRFTSHELNNTDRDYSIQRFLVLLKLSLKNTTTPPIEGQWERQKSRRENNRWD